MDTTKHVAPEQIVARQVIRVRQIVIVVFMGWVMLSVMAVSVPTTVQRLKMKSIVWCTTQEPVMQMKPVALVVEEIVLLGTVRVRVDLVRHLMIVERLKVV
jgi:hypothetical protein